MPETRPAASLAAAEFLAAARPGTRFRVSAPSRNYHGRDVLVFDRADDTAIRYHCPGPNAWDAEGGLALADDWDNLVFEILPEER